MLVQRADDKEEVVVDRLEAYNKTIKSMIDYYSAHNILYKIQGGDTIDDVFSSICDILEAV
jgi:Adenylate kinase and related kinases